MDSFPLKDLDLFEVKEINCKLRQSRKPGAFLAYLLPSVKLMSLKPTAEEASGEVYIGGRVDQQRGRGRAGQPAC